MFKPCSMLLFSLRPLLAVIENACNTYLFSYLQLDPGPTSTLSSTQNQQMHFVGWLWVSKDNHIYWNNLIFSLFTNAVDLSVWRNGQQLYKIQEDNQEYVRGTFVSTSCSFLIEMQCCVSHWKAVTVMRTLRSTSRNLQMPSCCSWKSRDQTFPKNSGAKAAGP